MDTARAAVCNEKARVAILTFEHFEAPGMDGVYPEILKESVLHFEQLLRSIIGRCLATGFVPEVYTILRAAIWLIDELLKGRCKAILSGNDVVFRVLSTSKIV